MGKPELVGEPGDGAAVAAGEDGTEPRRGGAARDQLAGVAGGAVDEELPVRLASARHRQAASGVAGSCGTQRRTSSSTARGVAGFGT